MKPGQSLKEGLANKRARLAKKLQNQKIKELEKTFDDFFDFDLLTVQEKFEKRFRKYSGQTKTKPRHTEYMRKYRAKKAEHKISTKEAIEISEIFHNDVKRGSAILYANSLRKYRRGQQ